MNWQPYVETCERAARAGGDVLRQWQGRVRAKEKGPKDLVTEADLASQRAIEAVIRGQFPDHGFLGEESGVPPPADSPPSSTRFRWIVDPLDGTTNYVHQLQTYAVSIALECDGEIVVGAVFDPVAAEYYSAAQGCGARLNGQPIHVSQCDKLSDAMVVASFAASVRRDSVDVQQFAEVLELSQAIRRLGSAALNLSYLAAGRLDAYWANSVSIWDVAAGVLLVREAGGTVTGATGQPFDSRHPRLVTAATADLHRELLGVLCRHYQAAAANR